ncbi:DUF4861 domain-containing protein [Bacteroides stercoris]|jgi:hypothetical protein|uniref:DUF4861 domain-containing protein n=1 Tax=Bacteroides TaxID=816 RepID=UPI0023303E42|nr:MULTISPECIES: DUF4861 domain-containing protein [Bacteroides]MCS3207661.1 DUF4861 domain-containing protein [Bacteroides stercoris]MDC2282961.1 DUF4861 domain-containing protein [Bacteroides stercoris]MDC2296614.1 DUF4861 domain-containing protein [Bacteroides stercoris]
MKKLLLLGMTALFCFACNDSRMVTVTVTNPLAMERSNEMVEVSMETVTDRLGLADTAQIVVLNADGQQVPYQITYDGKVIFPAAIAAGGTATYTIQTGTPEAFDVKACGRCYPERMDDMAWENDLVAFRAYGPALQAKGERGFGYDLFTKYNTTEPILEAMYAKELDKETLAKIAELKKTDPKAAAELSRERSYHIDHGYGMDCYAVGPTLGAGVAALMVNDTIIYPWCYKNQEILDNGPLRFTVKLEFTPLTVKGDSTVVETRLITLDAGSHLNKTAVSYSNLKETLPIVAGIVLHEPDGAVVADAANGYITYVDPTTGPDNGKIFMGAAVPAVVKDAKTVLFSEKEKKERNNADGHVLAVSDYEPGSEYVYYWGFAWDKADIKTADAWNRYMADFAQKVRNPLTVKVN